MPLPTWKQIKELSLEPDGDAIVTSKTGYKPGSSSNPNAIARTFRGSDGNRYIEPPIVPLKRGPWDNTLERILSLNNIKGDPLTAIFQGTGETDVDYSDRILSQIKEDPDIDPSFANQVIRGLQKRGALTRTKGRTEQNYKDIIQEAAFKLSHEQGIDDLIEAYGPKVERDAQNFLKQNDRQYYAVGKLRKDTWRRMLSKAKKGALTILAIGTIYLGYSFLSKSTPVYAASNNPEIINPATIDAKVSIAPERTQLESYLQNQFGSYQRFDGEVKGYVVQYNGNLGFIRDGQIQDINSGNGFLQTGETVNAFGYQMPVIAQAIVPSIAPTMQTTSYASSSGSGSGNSGNGNSNGNGTVDYGPFGLATMGVVGSIVGGSLFVATRKK